MDTSVPNDGEDGSDFQPGYRNFLVYCDDTGLSDSHYGWGTLWIPEEARGRLSALVTKLREKHRYASEIKWKNVKDRPAFYEELVDEFFQKNWLMFHALIVRASRVDMTLHEHLGEARLKHLATLLEKKVEFFAEGCPDKSYHVRVDPLGAHDGYAKADERLHTITNHVLASAWRRAQTDRVPEDCRLTTVRGRSARGPSAGGGRGAVERSGDGPDSLGLLRPRLRLSRVG